MWARALVALLVALPAGPPDRSGIAALISRLENKCVVFIGETHDSRAHHQRQLAVIRGLHRAGRQLAIGLECFQRAFQPALDHYVAGAIDEQTLLARTDYHGRWGFDPALYRPILRYARKHRIPLVALGLPAETTKRAGADRLAGVPPYSPDHLARLRRVHAGHRGLSFSRFVRAQLLRDEGMARAAADYLRAHPARLLVVLVGSGHLAGPGVPARLQRQLREVPTLSFRGHAMPLLALPERTFSATTQ
jgi:aminopeptidase N